ncbi:unnamed protein product [Phytophthora fragariaefolia]|uniref:Unnamed protein product n=1 Tax=Phytophthora fragariaefolia TaxID=1490495 RepID=A0A9W6X151_9STRA|nr:unnamed protein product [Phytophthora fragariaefolia]
MPSPLRNYSVHSYNSKVLIPARIPPMPEGHRRDANTQIYRRSRSVLRAKSTSRIPLLSSMAFLGGDEEILQTLLDFVDEHALDESGVGGSSTTTDIAVMEAECSAYARLDSKELKRELANEKRRRMRQAGLWADPNRARKKKRAEILEQLEQLQFDLQVLQQQETKSTGRQGQCTDTPSNDKLAVRAPSVWQELAMRQRARREKAERENFRLKLGVERQRRLAEALSDFLKRRASLVVSESC